MDAPSVSLTSPQKGSVLSGVINMAASAQDSSGIEKVEFYADDLLIGCCTTSPYQLTWDTRKIPDGSYTLTARAYDNAGNTGYSNCLQLSDTFDNNSKID
ncbi:MAG: Ig-like domain-containing protein, partial [Eubacteriales bacterium]